MEEEPDAAYCRYYCHMCSLIVSPELGIQEVKCPHCDSGFVEEMLADAHAGARRTSSSADEAGARPDSSELAVSPWPPILMDLLGVSYAGDGGSGDLTALARRHYRHLAFLQLLNAIREGDADAGADGNAAPDSGGLEQLVLVSPTDAHAMMLMEERGGGGSTNNGAVNAAGRVGPGLTLGELILGPGLDLLLEYLAETDPMSRQGPLPARKDAVAGMPTVRIREASAATCPVCLDEFAAGAEAKEMPCKHWFHGECIVPWLEAHSSCPVCRYQLPTDEAAEPPGNGIGNGNVNSGGEVADAFGGNARGGGGDGDGGSNGRRRWLARPFGRLFSRRSDGSSSSSR
ncbi:E3 ubiquitin-protein ligase SIRP1 [Brachypodium distachyon]|uniref:RING-type E3 ubiquitin transferase n=1 Tax=Brachypodium distachyon TaxID=15368 RepID=I1H5Y6_BRADI|nr:E3 ubiquitin-protein ligase SIRP1 [Brachypodium distachyon]XP_024313707.1 E3 ubiquitin-protein ligase SIRP1 [Brachypodium distachyon]KQK21885.1 hypothetical protein BRADI_1g63720v3 [Brachypodium distachyon]KQK21886.1 hypothetical protein BRADI_1g63720v3 [Brachypodium distachyon]|eukprot:XP_010228681.1 E3 ubiquitin-protein ligase SIRP1 [Brachypodium distachyon]